MKRNFKWLLFFSCMLLLTAFPIAAHADYDLKDLLYETPLPVTIHVNNKYVASDVMPYIENGRTLAPLRATAESVGSEVTWNPTTKEAIVKKNGQTAVFKQNAMTYSVNGEAKKLDVPLRIKNGRIMIPLRAMSEAINVSVEWDNTMNDVVITTSDRETVLPNIPYSAPLQTHTFIKKFYTQPTYNDPYTGSWKYYTEYYYNGQLYREHIYLFISKIDDNKYQVVEMAATTEQIENMWRIAVHNKTGHRAGNIFKSGLYGDTIYYFGLPSGFIGDGTVKYRLDGDQLIIFEIQSSLPNELPQNKYLNFDRF